MRVMLDSQHTTDLMTDEKSYFLRPDVCWGSNSASGMKNPRYIAFELYRHGADTSANRIWRIDPDGSNPLQLTSEMAALADRGRRLLFYYGANNIPLAAWFSPVFLLRFVCQQKFRVWVPVLFVTAIGAIPFSCEEWYPYRASAT